MKVTKELYDIIQELKPPQIKKIVQNFKMGKQDSNTIILFRILRKLKKYNVEKIKSKLIKEGRDKAAYNLGTEIALLYKFILRLLMTWQNETNDIRLRRKFNEVVFLENRGYFEKAKVIMRWLKKDVIKHNQDLLLIDMNRYEQGKLDAIQDRNNNFNNIFIIGFSLQLDQNNIVMLDQLVPSLLIAFEKGKHDQIDLSRKIDFKNLLAIYYFRKRNFKEAGKWIDNILNQKNDKQANLFNLIIMFELGGKDSLLVSLVKKAKYTNKGNETAFIVLNALSKLFIAYQKQRKLYKEDFKKALDRLDQVVEDVKPFYEVKKWLMWKVEE